MFRIKRFLTWKKRMYVEVLETLCSICLYLESDSFRSRNRYGWVMRDHFQQLKKLSQELREDIGEREDKRK